MESRIISEGLSQKLPWTTLEKYAKRRRIADGTYSVVLEATCRVTGKRVALKRMGWVPSKKSFILQELQILQKLKGCSSIIELLGVIYEKDNIYIVLEHLPTNLETIINRTTLHPDGVKHFMWQLLQAVAQMHVRGILHRDLKPNNILVAEDKSIRLIDFGMATAVRDGEMSTQVVTRWYRAPELLFGCRKYGTAVDMWSVGCIFAEMFLGEPLLPGNSDIDQLSRIYNCLGVPTEEIWPGMRDLPLFMETDEVSQPSFERIFENIPDSARDLLRGLLQYDPRKRLSADRAMKHEYFALSSPESIDLSYISTGDSSTQQNSTTMARALRF